MTEALPPSQGLAPSGSSSDERERRDDLLARGAILEAVGHASVALLKSGNWREAINEVLPYLARSIGADAAYLNELSEDEDGSVRLRNRAVWSLTPEADLPLPQSWLALEVGGPEHATHVARLRNGEPLALLLRDLPPSARAMLQKMGVRASVSIPVWAGDRLWGVLGFADRRREQTWSTEQLDALRLAATNVGWAIHRGLIADESARRHAILAAVRHTAERLLGTRSWAQAIPAILGEVGAAAGVSRAYIFERHTDVAEDWVVSQRFEWTAPGVSAQQDNPVLSRLSLAAFGEPRWIEELNRGSVVQRLVRKLHPPLQDLLLDQQILSIALVPIVPGGEPWGFIGFDDCEQERAWSAGELDALRAAASLLGSAIQRERSDEERRRSERRLRALIENLPGAVYRCEVRAPWRMLYLSEGISALCGIPARELAGSGRGYAEFVHPDDLSTVQRVVDEAVERRQPYTLEYRLVRPDGSQVWVLDRGGPGYDDSGAPVWLDGVLLDITARRAAEAVSRSRERLLEAVGFAAECFLDSPDWESSVVEVLDRLNAAAGAGRAILWREPGRERADPLGMWVDRSSGHLVSNEAPQWWSAVLADFSRFVGPLEPGAAVHVRTRDLSEPSQSGLAAKGIDSMLLVPIFVDGARWGIFGYGRLSDRREWNASEIEVMRMAARILGTAITRAWTDERLRIANATLENMTTWAQEKAQEAIRANTAKSAFLAAMSHEIRTPLTGVLGTMELLQDTALDPAQRELAAIATRSSHTLLALINDILDFSKIESGKLELESIEFDLRELVEDAVELLAEGAASKGLAMAAIIDPRVAGPVRGDPTRLRQVLVNLLGNAVKFTDQGEVVARVTCQNHDAESVVLQFSVRDTGVGISAAAREKLFQAFTQADMSTTRRYGGTGLGLTISRRLVEAMGGFIRLESEPGRGSEFAFTICLARGRALPASEPGHPSSHAGRRVLVLSRHAATREAIEAQLRFLGAETVLATDGPETFRILDAAEAMGRRFDLALVETRLDHQDELAIVEAIERHEASATMSMALLASVGERSGGSHADGRVHLVRPLRLARLEGLLRELGGTAKIRPTANPDESVLEGRVLVVDDNPINCQVTVRMVRSLGPSAVSVEDGAAAVEAVRRGEWSLVLMDHAMPVMDGLEATRRIRKLPGAAGRVPIVAVTATAVSELRAECLESGMNDFLTKPVERELLRQILMTWLPAQRAAA